MTANKTLAEWMKDREWTVANLVEATGLDQRVIESIVAHRYTTSPDQRERIAAALGVTADSVQWGNAVAVDHMYGHGPQFGRSP